MYEQEIKKYVKGWTIEFTYFPPSLSLSLFLSFNLAQYEFTKLRIYRYSSLMTVMHLIHLIVIHLQMYYNTIVV